MRVMIVLLLCGAMVVTTAMVVQGFAGGWGVSRTCGSGSARSPCSGTALQALPVELLGKIEEVRAEHGSKALQLENTQGGEAREALEEEIKALNVVLECDKALVQIEEDLAMFEGHLAGDDDKLKETAEVFSKEFTVCHAQIEGQLIALLQQ